ncbi:unnamed protein product [Bursaphelenchus okinawaensis]|uniref:CYtochrome P450 family n=1 Tax=Bursaphelenchus okinawaensis TaxID=465554 RepID=A0A811L542_9BILA|nr:unnamed protein product [Bursaphelenchus okinawaensis]CAG9117387.1 unnamed protein product [Bursaphelenchus okinawaensis]
MAVGLLIIFAISLIVFYNNFYKRRNLPPGPTPLPIVGNRLTLYLSKHWPDTFLTWKQQYGKMFTYWSGETPYIAIAEYKLANEMFVKNADIFFDRIQFGMLDKITKGGSYGLLFTGGALAREHRRFGIKIFKDFGMGKSAMQTTIIAETQVMLDSINKEINLHDEVDIKPFTDIAVSSVINVLMFGYRFTENNNEDKFRVWKKQSEDVNRLFFHSAILLWSTDENAYKYPFCKGPCEEFIQAMKALSASIMHEINVHKQRIEVEGKTEADDYVDAYLLERQRRLQNNEDASIYSEEQLVAIALDFWFAGQVTMTNTVCWCIAFMLHNPKVQEKMVEELDRVVGSDRIITMSDRNELPYMNAVINETQRRTNLGGENVARKVGQDCEFGGYSFKKGQHVVPQISVFLEDPEVFENPKDFNPERFLENGKLKSYDENVPFGMGKRSCMGESMAKMELFIFLANLFNQFTFKAGSEIPELIKADSGGGLTIAPYKCIVQRRREL